MCSPAYTPFDPDFRSRLATGLVLSLVVHLMAGLALIGYTSDSTRFPLMTAALPPPTPEEPIVRPGISRSQAVTINWLGFESPTEHQARPAEIDQAALSPLEPGLTEAETEPAEPAPSEVTLETVTESPAEVDAELAVAAAPATLSPESARDPSAPTLPEIVEEGAGFLAGQLVQIVKRTLEEASELEAAVERAAAQSLPEHSAPEQSASPASSAASGDVRDALPSESEAPATSREEPVKWAPGQPVAAEGLEITTVQPRWNISTRVSAFPRNPVVRIGFGRDGKVRKAEFLPGKSTGYREVDGPLLDALYRWTAKGEALEALPADDPEAAVFLPVEIVLVAPRGPIQRSSSVR